MAPGTAKISGLIVYKPAAALTNTIFDYDSTDSTLWVGYAEGTTEYTISFARSYFEAAVRDYNRIKALPVVSPDLLQPIVVNLNLGLSNLFGNQWTEGDKSTYADRRQKLMEGLMRTNPTEELVKQFHIDYPKLDPSRTFALSTLVRSGYPLAKGWNLAAEKPELYENLMAIYGYVKNTAEHTERSKSDTAVLLTLGDVHHYIRASARIVSWFLRHLYGGTIPSHAEVQFVKIFEADLDA